MNSVLLTEASFRHRLKDGYEDIASMCGMLNWRGSTPFGELSGIFPMNFLTNFERNTMINFSSDIPLKVSNNLLLHLIPR